MTGVFERNPYKNTKVECAQLLFVQNRILGCKAPKWVMSYYCLAEWSVLQLYLCNSSNNKLELFPDVPSVGIKTMACSWNEETCGHKFKWTRPNLGNPQKSRLVHGCSLTFILAATHTVATVHTCDLWACQYLTGALCRVMLEIDWSTCYMQ